MPSTSFFIGCRNRPVTSSADWRIHLYSLLNSRQLTLGLSCAAPFCPFRGTFLQFLLLYMEKDFERIPPL